MGSRPFWQKNRIAREFIENQCYSTLMDIKFCHTTYPSKLSTYEKDMAFERALKSVRNTHMRNKSNVFHLECSFLANKSVHLDIST